MNQSAQNWSGKSRHAPGFANGGFAGGVGILSLPALLLLVSFSGVATAQVPLTVERIMQEPKTWVGSSPGSPSWSEDGQWLYFNWNPQGVFPADSLYRVSRGGGAPELVPPDERRQARSLFEGWAHGTLRYDSDFTHKVFEDAGDLYLHDKAGRELVRLTQTTARESQPRFTPDDQGVVFREGNNLFWLDLESGSRRQLTDLRAGKERPEKKPSAQDAWLEEQQEDLFDVLRKRIEEREEREEARDRDTAALAGPPVHYYGEGRLGQLQVDPTERFVTFQVTEDADSPGTIVQNYVTDSGYAEDMRSRSKVGAEPSENRLYLQDLRRDTTFQVDLTSVEGAFDVVPAHLVSEGVEVDSSKARNLRAFGPYWSGDGRYAVLDIRAADNKDRWLVRLHPETGELSVLDRQSDEAWIGGPGTSSWGGSSSVGWMPDNRWFRFQSEETGYSHLYVVDAETGETRRLTEGAFEVQRASLSRDGSTWHLTTSEESPHERHFYTMPAKGGRRTRLTSMVGSNAVALNPDERTLAMVYSASTQPPEIYLQQKGRDAERITHSTTEAWNAYPWSAGEIIQIPASDGVDVPAQIFRPENPNGAAVLFVHGAGYLQNVHRWWSSYFREFMFNNLLVERGYTVLNVDYRASSGYGRDWRTAIYRHMGGRDLQDYVDASEYVGREFGIDPERVFLYGGSYGGFITLMALFNEPEHFGGGAALRSVTDWAHYNHGYTSNILNTPVTDSLAYARSSPINFADGLEDPLLMAHGVIDDNVQYQDIIRLAQRFIELGKTGWELASYPVERHGFTEPSSWTDEYRRILDLIETSVGPDRRR